MGTLSLAPTPNGQHDTWLFKLSGEEEARRNENDQSIRDARNKAQREEIAGKRARLSLTHRAQSFSMKLPLVSAPDRAKARNSLSAQVRRAEQPPEDRGAANATRRANDQVRRAEQLPEDRDAANATRRANDQARRAEQPPEDRTAVNATRRTNDQVTISARLHCAPCTHLCVGVRSISHKPKLMTHSSFDGPRSL